MSSFAVCLASRIFSHSEPLSFFYSGRGLHAASIAVFFIFPCVLLVRLVLFNIPIYLVHIMCPGPLYNLSVFLSIIMGGGGSRPWGVE